MKSLRDAKAGKPTPGPCAYLSVLQNPNVNFAALSPKVASSVEESCDPAYLLSLYKYRALIAVSSIGAELDRKFAVCTREIAFGRVVAQCGVVLTASNQCNRLAFHSTRPGTNARSS
jgi:hypothetical protein